MARFATPPKRGAIRNFGAPVFGNPCLGCGLANPTGFEEGVLWGVVDATRTRPGCE
jgi:hypothetical protein